MTITAELELLWQARFRGDVATAREGVTRLLAANDLTPTERAEVHLLEASFARNEGQAVQAWSHIERARTLFREAGVRGHFQLSLQAAICRMTESRSADALGLLQEAVRLGRGNPFLLTAKYNVAVCQHNLGLPTSAIIAEIERDLASEPNHPLAHGLQTLHMMEMDTALRSGDFAQVFARDFAALSHGSYIQSLWAALPWLGEADQRNVRERFVAACAGESDFFHKNYRLQTLAADSRLLTEEPDVPLQLRVDRLFLWTWKWLQKPDSSLTTNLAEEWARFPWDQAHVSLTSTDFFLLRSAGGWLAAFHSGFARLFKGWLEKSFPAELARGSFFELDAELSRALREDSWPAWNERLETARRAHPELARYFAFVSFLRTAPVTFSEDVLVVNAAERTLARDGKTLVSEPVALLLAALKKENSLSFAESLLIAYQIPGFDSHLHGPKINNLVQRAKTWLPESVRLWSKNQRLYFADPEDTVALREGSAHAAFFPIQGDAHVGRLAKKQTARLEKNTDRDGKVKLFALFEKNSQRSRQEIQSFLGLPKATTNRWISRWISARVLERTGSGKNALYRIVAFDSPISSHE